MKCISPYIKKRDYQSITGETTDVVPCGKCVVCLKRRQSGWTFRLNQEKKRSTSVGFITLTYDDEHINFTEEKFATLRKKDWQDFMKKLRKQMPKFPYTKKNGDIGYKSNIKYYTVGEYGTQTQRPHFHSILFNLPLRYLNNPQLLADIWGKGAIDIGQGNSLTFNYVAGYVQKKTFTPDYIVDTETGEIIEDTREPENMTCSKNLGDNFITPQMVKYLKNRLQGFVMIDGKAQALPRYYKEKIFTKEERKIMHEAAVEAANADFTKLFNNDYKKLDTWTKELLRKQKKSHQMARIKL